MTEIEIIGSSSQANGYLLKSADQILVLELGCRFMDYVEALNEDFYKIEGCCVSHCHSDHFKYPTAQEMLRRGNKVYFGENVYNATATYFFSWGFSRLLSHFPNKVGGFTIQTFEAPHNVPNCGFLVKTPTNERILFLTDTTGVNLRFRDINAIMVECNNDDDTLLDNLANNDVSMSHPEYHLGLNDCAEFCKQNLSASTKQIILIHMSSTNINPYMAVEKVKQALNNDTINVDFAEKGKKFFVESDFF